MVVPKRVDVDRTALDEDLPRVIRLVHPQEGVPDAIEVRVRDRPER